MASLDSLTSHRRRFLTTQKRGSSAGSKYDLCDPSSSTLSLPDFGIKVVESPTTPGFSESKSTYYSATSHGVRSANSSASWFRCSKSSHASYHSAISGTSSKKGSQRTRLNTLTEEDEYAQLLQSRHLWPVNPDTEQNWSGRGQHARFMRTERRIIDEILEVQETIGTTNTAIVQSVKCKRILLARKTLFLSRQFTKEQAVAEVAHMSNLNHSHVIRLIGTYAIGRELSILLYPVADYNLEAFLETMLLACTDRNTWSNMVVSCTRFFSCLSHAVKFIHEQLMKHMDIKPQNILVRNVSSRQHDPILQFKVYIADFGIAKSYDAKEAVETDGPTSFTRKYAAPEVTDQEKRGLPADIFSLGCVFTEMVAVLLDVGAKKPGSVIDLEFYDEMQSGSAKRKTRLEGLINLLRSHPHGDSSYQGNIDVIGSWLAGPRHLNLVDSHGNVYLPLHSVDWIIKALSKTPSARPDAETLCRVFGEYCCCTKRADPLEVFDIEPDVEED